MSSNSTAAVVCLISNIREKRKYEVSILSVFEVLGIMESGEARGSMFGSNLICRERATLNHPRSWRAPQDSTNVEPASRKPYLQDSSI